MHLYDLSSNGEKKHKKPTKNNNKTTSNPLRTITIARTKNNTTNKNRHTFAITGRIQFIMILSTQHIPHTNSKTHTHTHTHTHNNNNNNNTHREKQNVYQ